MPKRISIRMRNQMRWFLTIWIAVVGFILFSWTTDNVLNGANHSPFDFALVIGLTIAMGYMPKIVKPNLADDVYDCGDHLLFVYDSREFKVQFSAIVKVATLRGRIYVTTGEGAMEATYGFQPAFRFPFFQSPIIDEVLLKTPVSK